MTSAPRLAPLLACLALLGAAPARAQAPEPDPWFGPDKALHFGASAGLAVAGYAASALVLEQEPHRLIAGGAFAFGLGIAKELWDLSGHGDPSWKDLTWDAIGTATGLGIAWAIDHFLLAPSRVKPAVQPARAARWVPDGPFVFQLR